MMAYEISEKMKQFAEQLANHETFVGPSKFAGAIIIIPPEGEIKSMIVQAGEPNLNFFWSQVQLLVKLAIEAIEDDQRKRNPFQ